METIVTARIDVSKPAGRKIARELENKKYVELEYPMIGGISEKNSHKVIFGRFLDRLSEHYNYDMHEGIEL
ncbi:MAG: hypothetical protein LBJ60_01740 [Tannerellaceae bacterium]|jgi:hypothetical protein|nr:hypothetical protein [Tannerellaceae bacterium]